MANLSPRSSLTATGVGAACLALLMSPRAHADADPGYTDLTAVYDAIATFENSFGSDEDALFVSDSVYLPNLISASGIDVGGRFPSTATASDDVATIEGGGATIASQLTTLQSDITND